MTTWNGHARTHFIAAHDDDDNDNNNTRRRVEVPGKIFTIAPAPRETRALVDDRLGAQYRAESASKLSTIQLSLKSVVVCVT